MIARCLVALALVAGNIAATPITIAEVAPRDVADSMVDRICSEAEAIWEPAGIALKCTRVAPEHESPRPVIEVTIDDRLAPSGLWPTDQVFALERTGFELTSEEEAVALSHLRAELMSSDNGPGVPPC